MADETQDLADLVWPEVRPDKFTEMFVSGGGLLGRIVFDDPDCLGTEDDHDLAWKDPDGRVEYWKFKR